MADRRHCDREGCEVSTPLTFLDSWATLKRGSSQYHFCSMECLGLKVLSWTYDIERLDVFASAVASRRVALVENERMWAEREAQNAKAVAS